MKKILLLLNLIAFTAISQVTPVGGYLPLNSTKSATMGGLRVNGNEIVTGTFSVGSTATITGVLTTNSVVANTGQLRLYSGTNSDLILRAVGASQAITSEINGAPKFQVNSSGATVTGSLITTGTHSLGSANLTGGNTGTVAVLSDALFTTTHFHGLATVATSVFFYDKYNSSSGSSSSSGAVGVTYIPFNCTLVGYSLFNGVLGTLGSSSATVAVRVNNTTDVVLNSAVQYTASAQSYSSAALSTTIAAGSYIEIKVTPNNTPTAATNAIQQITLFFARRQ